MLDMIAYLRRMMNADANETFDPATDSLEALANRVQLIDFWSVPQESLTVSNVATDRALPDVVVAGLAAGWQVMRVVAMLKFRIVAETSSAPNALNGAQEIQVRDNAPGAWADAINFVVNQFTLQNDVRESGDVQIGPINIVATVVGNGTYNFRWEQALADGASLVFYDIQVGLRIWVA